jgi:hypothetical protein
MQWVIVWLSTALALFGATPAHQKFHFEGKVCGIQDDQLYVDVALGTIVIFTLGMRTMVFHDEERVNASELHSGYSVSVDGLGHDPSDLEAAFVSTSTAPITMAERSPVKIRSVTRTITSASKTFRAKS